MTLLLCDLDNTLALHETVRPTDAVRAWVKELTEAGIQVMIVSNNRSPARVEAYCGDLGIPYVGHAGKPKRGRLLEAMRQFDAVPETTALVGASDPSPMCWAPAAAVFSLSAWSRSVAATACGTGRRIGFRIHSASPPAEGGSGRKRENAASNKVQGMLQSEEPALCAAKRQHTGLVFDRSCLFCQSRGVVTSFCALSKAEAVNTLSRISWSASVLFSLAIGVESA